MQKEGASGLLVPTVDKWIPQYPRVCSLSRVIASVTPATCRYTLNNSSLSRFIEHLLCTRFWARKTTQVLVLEKCVDW